MKLICIRASILLLGIVMYYTSTWIFVWFVMDVLDIAVSTADFRSLVVMVAWKLIPLLLAFILVAWLWSKTRATGVSNER